MKGYHVLLVALILNNYLGDAAEESSTWINTCADEGSGDVVHVVKVEDHPVSPKNCTIKKGRQFNVTLDFSLHEAAESLTLSCRGKYGFITIPVLTTTNDCSSLTQLDRPSPLQKKSISLQTELTPETELDSIPVVKEPEEVEEAPCSKLHPAKIYQFSSFGKCPSWIPSVTIDIVCTCTNEQRKKTHCVRFPCRIHN